MAMSADTAVSSDTSGSSEMAMTAGIDIKSDGIEIALFVGVGHG